MRILDARVNWHQDTANRPRLAVLVDECPDRDRLRFSHHDGLWCGTHDGYAEYYAWSGSGNDGGHAGRTISITTTDGDNVTLRGPWSSRAGCINAHGLGPVVDVQLTTDPASFEEGGGLPAGSVTLAAAKRATDLAASASHLKRVLRFDADEPYWIPVRGDTSGGGQ